MGKFIKRIKVKKVIIAIIVVCVSTGIYAIVYVNLKNRQKKNNMIPLAHNRVRSYVEKRDGFYVGDLLKDKFDGKGLYKLNTGDQYSGRWKKGQPDGEGVLELKNIGNYKGYFKNGIREGQGTFTWIDGTIYRGEWSNDQIEGDGELTYKNGTIIQGSFEGNEVSNANLTTKDKKLLLTFTDGVISEGTYIAADGTKYSGPIDSGQFDGENCQINYKNGDSYEGTLKANLKSGEGTYTWKKGPVYEGEWSNDQMDGEGIYYFTHDEDGKSLEGTFKKNKPEGEIKYYDGDDFYETQWNNGKCVKMEASDE